MTLNPNKILSLASCIVSGVGFALWFHVDKKHILFCALGSLLTWGVYLLTDRLYPSVFVCTIAASSASALFAQLMARANKAGIYL